MALADADIIRRIKHGHIHAYAHLVDRYKSMGMTLALRMLGDREDAEEATQDAFLRAYHALPEFEQRSKFSTWFYRILYNVCLTRIERRGARFEFADESDSRQEVSSAVPGPLDDLVLKDLAGHVRRALEQLPPKYGALLTMFYLQELSHAEISEVTGLSVNTIKVQLFRGREMLGRLLASVVGETSGNA